MRKALAAVFFLAALVASGLGGGRVPQDTDLVIVKSEITPVAKFYPYRSGKTYMELFAVRAPDGSVRTAFNTCQVCYDSGRGYYIQQGSLFVCQNCGNRFRLDQIEIIHGGCNPVPITRELKSETRETITISAEVLARGAFLFARWAKR